MTKEIKKKKTIKDTNGPDNLVDDFPKWTSKEVDHWIFMSTLTIVQIHFEPSENRSESG